MPEQVRHDGKGSFFSYIIHYETILIRIYLCPSVGENIPKIKDDISNFYLK